MGFRLAVIPFTLITASHGSSNLPLKLQKHIRSVTISPNRQWDTARIWDRIPNNLTCETTHYMQRS